MTPTVRIAPSPTGLLHIGNIRAALTNWLFARKLGGQFMLRLDDTDLERSRPEYAEAIERDLKWLGLDWDFFARQSDRMDRYAAVAEGLKAAGLLYPCYETSEELSLKRKMQLGRGLPPLYDRAALKLDDAARAKFEADGRKPHWRFRLSPDDVTWDDLVQGPKHFPGTALSDPVLIREDGVPLYTFCSVVDDVDFDITHVIRGEDHVANTAVQIQIWKAVIALEKRGVVPIFAHFPLLSTIDGQEMSKRLGTLSVASMRDEMGLEPLAITSLLSRLGTSDPILPRLSLAEMVEGFDIAKISRATPKFDLAELKALNAKLLHHMPFASVQKHLGQLGYALDESLWDKIRGNVSCLSEVSQWLQIINGPVTPQVADAALLSAALACLPTAPWSQDTWGAWTKQVKADTGLAGKALFMPLRLALTGLDHGPELKDLLPLIGPEKAAARLKGIAA
jgi:glutamyl-tRNA synthetase